MLPALQLLCVSTLASALQMHGTDLIIASAMYSSAELKKCEEQLTDFALSYDANTIGDWSGLRLLAQIDSPEPFAAGTVQDAACPPQRDAKRPHADSIRERHTLAGA